MEKKYKAMVEDRRIYNLMCTGALIDIINAHPDLRFCQILHICGLGCEEKFSEEPKLTLDHIKNSKLYKHNMKYRCNKDFMSSNDEIYFKGNIYTAQQLSKNLIDSEYDYFTVVEEDIDNHVDQEPNPCFKEGDLIRNKHMDTAFTVTGVNMKEHKYEIKRGDIIGYITFEDQENWVAVPHNKPKYKTGNSIIWDNKLYFIEDVLQETYLLRDDVCQSWYSSKDVDNNARPWNISDASECDILVDKYGNIGMFNRKTRINWYSHVYLGADGEVYYLNGTGGCHEIEGTKPANVYQINKFFDAIHSKGLEWDANEGKVVPCDKCQTCEYKYTNMCKFIECKHKH